MSTQAGPKPAKTFTLTSLPHDVLLHLFDHLTPSQIAVYSQLSRTTAATAADPYIWASVARRHLGVAPPHTNTLSATTVSRLATDLVCRWWLAVGAFVAGLPAHFRKGFAEVRARGGIEVAVHPDSTDSCYVFGGRHKEASVPVAVPSVACDFTLDPAGPFPMDGMRIRLIHASEPAEPSEDQTVDASPRATPVNAAHMTEMSLGPPFLDVVTSRSQSPSLDKARIHVKLNNTTVLEAAEPDPNVFSVLDVCIGPELLLNKPRMNTLVIEYDRASSAAYWLKEVSLVPAILPMKPVPAEKLVFGMVPTSHPKLTVPRVHQEPELKPELDAEDSLEHRECQHEQDRVDDTGDGSPSPRRLSRQLEGHTGNDYVNEAVAGAKPRKTGKHQKQGRKPKHVYHHNGHRRSPRGHATVSQRSRSGR